jgi:hypothetical protein
MKTVRLLLWSAVAYTLVLVLTRGILPSESAPAISLTAIPLIVVVVMIVRDLADRSTTPTLNRSMIASTSFQGTHLQFLSGQFRVAASASNSYFENVVQSRLRELLTGKVVVEMGLEQEVVRRILSDPRQGARLLKDETLYRMVYGPSPQGARARMRMIGDAIDMIGAWKA